MTQVIQDDYSNEVHPGARTINARLDAGDERMTRIESDLRTNTAATEQIRSNTADLVEFFQAAQGAFKVLNWIGRAAKPLTYIATLCASLWGLWLATRGHK